jgi:hypothetical protein
MLSQKEEFVPFCISFLSNSHKEKHFQVSDLEGPRKVCQGAVDVDIITLVLPWCQSVGNMLVRILDNVM